MESEIRKEDAIQDDKKEKLKRKAFEKHKKIIELTIMCGNQVALVPQLIEILLNTNTYKNKKQIYDALTLLEKHKLIYKKDFGSCKYIELRNPVITWAIESPEGLKERYGDLYSTNKKAISDDVLYTSMFKFEYLITHTKNQSNLDDVMLTFLRQSTLFYTRGRGYGFFKAVKGVFEPQIGEFLKIEDDLYAQRQKQKLSAIKEEYLTEKQREKKEFFNSYNLKFNDYNLNSFLANNNLSLVLNEKKIINKRYMDFADIGKKEVSHDINLYFTLNIFDIRNNLKVNDIARLSSRVYKLLEEMLRGDIANNTALPVLPLNGPCSTCERCIYNKKYDSKNKNIVACDPREIRDRQSCKKIILLNMDRFVYLTINYVSWNKEKASLMDVNANKRVFENGELREEPNLKDKIIRDNNSLNSNLYNKYIKFNSINYDLERYGVNKGEDNIAEYNERQEQKAIYKEEVKNNDEFLQILLFLKDNFELLQLLKDNLEDFRAYLISNSIPNNLIENTDVKEEEEIMKYYEENFNLIDEEIKVEEDILEFDINDVEY